MEFLVVSKRKLKIVLDKSEVDKYRLSEFSSGDSIELRKRLAEVLLEAKLRVGFDSAGERLLVSYYPTRLSGAELFITVIGAEDSSKQRSYYIFESLGDITAACRAAKDTDGESSAYLLPSGEYCLAVSRSLGDVLSEFSSPLETDSVEPFLTHSKRLVSEGAVAIFAKI